MTKINKWIRDKQASFVWLVVGFIGVLIGYQIDRGAKPEVCESMLIPKNATFISLSSSKLSEGTYPKLLNQRVAIILENKSKNLRCRIHFRSAKLIRDQDPIVVRISPLDAASIYRAFRGSRNTSFIPTLVQAAMVESLPVCGDDSRVQYEDY